MTALLRLHWGDEELSSFHEGFRTISRKPLSKGDVKPPEGTYASEDPQSADLWRRHLKTRKPKDARKHKLNELNKEVHELQPEDYHVLAPGENVLLYDEDDESLVGVVIWDFIEGGAIPGTHGHGLLEYIDKTILELARPLRNIRVSLYRIQFPDTKIRIPSSRHLHYTSLYVLALLTINSVMTLAR